MGEDYVYVREASFLSANHEVGGSFIGLVGDLLGVSGRKFLDFFRTHLRNGQTKPRMRVWSGRRSLSTMQKHDGASPV
jgi:hypothetical protein